jgi:hypothetical protein
MNVFAGNLVVYSSMSNRSASGKRLRASALDPATINAPTAKRRRGVAASNAIGAERIASPDVQGEMSVIGSGLPAVPGPMARQHLLSECSSIRSDVILAERHFLSTTQPRVNHVRYIYMYVNPNYASWSERKSSSYSSVTSRNDAQVALTVRSMIPHFLRVFTRPTTAFMLRKSVAMIGKNFLYSTTTCDASLPSVSHGAMTASRCREFRRSPHIILSSKLQSKIFSRRP